MAQLTQFETLYPRMLLHLPGCETHLMLLALQDVGRKFCIDTEAFRDDLIPLVQTDYQQDYTLTSEYDATIHRLRSVKVNGEDYLSRVDLIDESLLRFKSNYIPHDLDDDRCLLCGTAGITLISEWQLITDGSFTFEFDDSTYLVSGLDFSTDSDMDAVALRIQTAIRTAVDENYGRVRWDAENTRFAIWRNTGEMSYLTAGTAGTDISGAGYMNGLTGGTGVSLGPVIEVEVVFRPDMSTQTFPNWFLDRWAEALLGGAIAYLAKMPKKAYTNPVVEAQQREIYNTGWVRARRENRVKFKNGATTLHA